MIKSRLKKKDGKRLTKKTRETPKGFFRALGARWTASLAKAFRERARQFYERARQAVRYGALSTRAVRFYNAFCRKVRIGKLWFTSSTWGGWWFAALLLAVVFGVGAIYLYFIPDKADTLQHLHKADTLQHLQFYAVIVIGLGSLYIAGTSLWEKRGSAFSVEYLTEIDSNVAEFFTSSIIPKEKIGNPANSIMPYVKKLYIRNEKNRHEAIKKILLQLPNKQTIILKEYEKADAPLLIKPYEDKVLELNAVTVYCEKCNLSYLNKNIPCRGNKFMRIPNEEVLKEGKIIIETVRGQAYIRSNEEPIVSYDKEKLLTPLRRPLNPDNFNDIILDINVLYVNIIFMKKDFLDNEEFYDEVAKQLNAQGHSTSKFASIEGAIKIQATLNAKSKASLCYSFEVNEKTYTFPVKKVLYENFAEACAEKYNKFNFKKIMNENFNLEFINFYIQWIVKNWNQDLICSTSRFSGATNQLAAVNLDRKTINNEEP